METQERTEKQVWLEQSFTLDLWHVNPDGSDEAVHFRVALSALGSLRENPPMRIGFSDTLIGAVIAFYPDHGDGYAIQPETIQHPAGMTRGEAIAVIKAVFEKSGRGAEAEDDWAWLPIVLSDYLATIFPWPRYEQIAELLREEVKTRNAQVLGKENIKENYATCGTTCNIGTFSLHRPHLEREVREAQGCANQSDRHNSTADTAGGAEVHSGIGPSLDGDSSS